MQNNLLETMKNEYHKKVGQLESELAFVEKEKSEHLKKADTAQQKSKVEDSFKHKLKELEDKLKNYKAKDREQAQMLKESGRQKTRIKSLESEIGKIRSQKVSMMRKMKEEQEKHRRWRNDRAKEIIQIKK